MSSITALNKAYMIHVIPELATYPSLEEEFVKAAQDLLDQGIFQQMIDSKQGTSTFEKLKTFLIGTYGRLSAPKSSLGLTTAGWRKVNGLHWPT